MAGNTHVMPCHSKCPDHGLQTHRPLSSRGVAVRDWYFSVQPGGVPGTAQLLLLPSVTWWPFLKTATCFSLIGGNGNSVRRDPSPCSGGLSRATDKYWDYFSVGCQLYLALLSLALAPVFRISLLQVCSWNISFLPGDSLHKIPYPAISGCTPSPAPTLQ